MTITFTRRALAVGSVLAATALAVSACSSTETPQNSSDTIVVSTFPFGVDQMTEAIFDPFTKATGIKVKVDTGSNADRLSRLQLEGDKSGIDVMMISDTFAALGDKDGLFQKVDAAKIPELANIAEFAKDDSYTGPAYSYQLNGVLFNKDKVSAKEAASWDLFSDASLKGRLALPNYAVTSGPLTVAGVAQTFGKGATDVDTAFTKMHAWSPNILQFYSSTTEFTNLLTQGEIYAGVALNGFATPLVKSDDQFAWTAPEKGRYMATNRAMIPTGATNVDGANKFINFLLSQATQQSSAEIVGDLPVNLSAKLPQDLSAVVGDIAKDPSAHGYKTISPADFLPNRNEWTERFNREVIGQ
ncbi:MULTISPECIES: ABC transporter substrate-binding protein [Arthrobacter]|uniref:ABC transporter substrate-binding protein n=1 Tax=Arthrobacter psychrochitiniphilus TaxID=291045 RepID=A0A2V3DST0_9MICC|nr:extracellular solute-binding protein [Arthrobacter psychrochitiniphilus]NYG17756.1 spermidine/putrescine-binding protein [Arthrobacter psychrochitiniphilus]PXA65194.1 hypothetical protein CVS29_10980 [Arthrobacter psychrochitiniphilus]